MSDPAIENVHYGQVSTNERVRVVVGDEALSMLKDPVFQQQWMALYARCPWAWVAELPEFLLPWYEVYDNFPPVVAYQQDTAGQLVGLLPLCRHPDTMVLVRGGYDDAEYLSWLCEANASSRFMPEALQAVGRAVGRVPVEIGWVSPETPLQWVDEGRAGRCSLEPIGRFTIPVRDAGHVDQYLRSKKRLKTKLNKLKREGDLQFRRYRKAEELNFLFDHFFPLMYFRKAAAYGHTPFTREGEARKRRLLLRLAETPGLFHASALELDGVPVAAHMGPAARGFFCLAGLVHAPHLGLTSPGQQLLLHLVRCLHEEGFHTFDMSPGPESYKERLGENPEMVYKLRVHGDKAHYLASRARKGLASWAKRTLPAPLVDQIRKLRAGEPGEHAEQPPPPIYAQGPNASLPAPANLLGRNKVPDLLCFPRDDEARWVAFQRVAERYLSPGGTSLTHCVNHRLHAAWFLVPAKGDYSLVHAALPRDAWVLRAAPQGPVPLDVDAALQAALASIPEALRVSLYATVDRPELAATLQRAGWGRWN